MAEHGGVTGAQALADQQALISAATQLSRCEQDTPAAR
jgi:hypothetical protein